MSGCTLTAKELHGWISTTGIEKEAGQSPWSLHEEHGEAQDLSGRGRLIGGLGFVGMEN